MRLFNGGGGRSNPDFRYKIRVKRMISDLGSMMDWCDQYPVTGEGHFERYYVNFRDENGSFDGEYTTFQFEREEPALMFALTFGAA